MKIRGKTISPFFIAVAAAIAATVTVCICAVSCRSGKIYFKACYYFVCYAMRDNSVSASSISSAVTEYGGAGYILEHGGAYYVTVACYYTQNDADEVCAELKGRTFDCSVLKIETDEYCLQTAVSKKYGNLYVGNLNTLHSLSKIAYECANALDTGEYGQANAKNVLVDIKNGLDGLLKTNSENCFTTELQRLKAVCNDAAEGYVYSKDLRKLQIAILDTVINIQMY